MPAKTKRPTRTARTTRTTTQRKPKNLGNRIGLFSSRRFWIIAAVLVLVGTFALFRANAAVTLPGGKAAWQRFPGDPNPKVTGKMYWGAGIGGNGDPARHETPAGKSLSLRRTFWDMRQSKVTSMVNTATADIAANRLPQVSVKVPLNDWAGTAAGKYDKDYVQTNPDGTKTTYTGLDATLQRLDRVGGPVWFTVHHEPENDISGGRTTAAWRAMQKHVRDRMNALGTKNIAFMPILMTWTWDPASGRNPSDYWVDGIWDAYGVDPYAESEGKKLSDSTGWKNFVTWIEAKGMPFTVAEWGLTTAENGRSWIVFDESIYKNDRDSEGNKDYSRYCTAVHNGDPTLLKQTTEKQEQVAYDNMKYMWNWSRSAEKKRDLIGLAYFDSCLNAENGPWRLAGRQLDGFREIMKDPNVLRVNDIPNLVVTDPVDPGDTGGGTDTGELAINITAPKLGDTVSGIKKVVAGPSTNVKEVSFRLDGKWQTTDSSAPFEWDWNTATTTNGDHTLTIRARKVGDPGGTYTEKGITVKVNNQTSTPTPTDLLKPSKPADLKASLRFDVLKARYVVDTSWLQSKDDVSGVKQYQVVRDFTILGNAPQPANSTERTKFTDSTALQAGKTYRYTVTAIDGTGKQSDPTTISVKTSCFLVFCNLEQL